MKTKLTIRVAPDLARKLETQAGRARVSVAAVVEAAVASHLSPDGADRREAAFTRRLDRLSRQVERLQRDQTVTAEAVALFVRFWLSVTPQLPDTQQAAARAKGAERYAGYVEALGRRLQAGKSLVREVSEEIAPEVQNEAAMPTLADADPAGTEAPGVG